MAASPKSADHLDTVQKLLAKVHGEVPIKRSRKITVVGAGAVGLACAYSILNQGLASELAMVDVVEDKLKGECMDLQHGMAFAKRCIVKASSDYAVSAQSDFVVITAGARQREGESRLDLVGRNLAIFKSIIPQIVAASPECTICVVSNPVDILTWVVAKLAGLPPGRVFGSGTSLDSSRFRTLVADRVGIDARSVHGLILGEHGDSSVAAWSSLNVGGVRLRDINPAVGTPGDEENWAQIHKDVIGAAGEVIKAKGYTNWAIGLTVASLAESVLRNEHRVVPLSVPVRGLYGIDQDVYLSLPAVVGIDGVREIVTIPLDEDEEAKLRSSAKTIAAVQAGLHF